MVYCTVKRRFWFSVSGGNKQRHTGDPAVHGLCVRSVKQRAWSPASHLQTSEGMKQLFHTDSRPQYSGSASSSTLTQDDFHSHLGDASNYIYIYFFINMCLTFNCSCEWRYSCIMF